MIERIIIVFANSVFVCFCDSIDKRRIGKTFLKIQTMNRFLHLPFRTITTTATRSLQTESAALKQSEKLGLQDFLKRIGRQCHEYSDKIKSIDNILPAKPQSTSAADLAQKKSPSEYLKEQGVPIKQRRYILKWVAKYYRHGSIAEPLEIPPYKKPIRGPKWRY